MGIGRGDKRSMDATNPGKIQHMEKILHPAVTCRHPSQGDQAFSLMSRAISWLTKDAKSHFQYLKMSQGNVQSYNVIYDREIKHGTVGPSEACGGHFLACRLKQDEQLAQHWLKVMCLAIQGHTVTELDVIGSHCKECSNFSEGKWLQTPVTVKIFQHWSNKNSASILSSVQYGYGLWPVSAMSFIKYLMELSSQFKHPGGKRNSSVL